MEVSNRHNAFLEWACRQLTLRYRAHIVQDIIPYTCIIHSCETPAEMYLTAESLLAHIIENHAVTRWACDYCAHLATGRDISVEHQALIFETAEAWNSHFADIHPEKLAVIDRSLLAELSKRQMFQTLSCPLCQELKVDIDTMDTKVDDHILRHLHEFSLLALPEITWDTSKTLASTSRKSSLLSQVPEKSTNSTYPLSYAEVTLSQLQQTIEETWPIIRPDQQEPRPEVISQLPRMDVSDIELIRSKAYRLQEVLNAVKRLPRDRFDCKQHYDDCLHTQVTGIAADYTEVRDLVDELNAISKSRPNIPKRQCESDYILSHYFLGGCADCSSGGTQ
jgi:hypothetical protein